MEEEMKLFKENDIFELIILFMGKNLVGGKWVYIIKENVEGFEIFKVRYVVKGYS